MPLFKKKPKKENGLLDSAVANNAPPEPTVGIFVQWVKHEEQGEVIALYCEACKRTDFYLSPWATKSDTPFFQYWKVTLPCMIHEIRSQNFMIGTFKQSVMGGQEIDIPEKKATTFDIFQKSLERPLGRLE